MSFLDDNYQSLKLGMEGEGIVRDYLKSQKIPFMQVDLVFKKNNKWYSAEIKSQYIFKAPPFDGHGLPQWQIDARVRFFNDTGVIPLLIVYDLAEKCLYLQSLLFLVKKTAPMEVLKTTGHKPRTIYNINLFQKITI